jgi:hypothetical protein
VEGSATCALAGYDQVFQQQPISWHSLHPLSDAVRRPTVVMLAGHCCLTGVPERLYVPPEHLQATAASWKQLGGCDVDTVAVLPCLATAGCKLMLGNCPCCCHTFTAE